MTGDHSLHHRSSLSTRRNNRPQPDMQCRMSASDMTGQQCRHRASPYGCYRSSRGQRKGFPFHHSFVSVTLCLQSPSQEWVLGGCLEGSLAGYITNVTRGFLKTQNLCLYRHTLLTCFVVFFCRGGSSIKWQPFCQNSSRFRKTSSACLKKVCQQMKSIFHNPCQTLLSVSFARLYRWVPLNSKWSNIISN